jgi:hypothetical protein
MAITNKGKWRQVWELPDNSNRDATYHNGNKTIYHYDYRYRKEDPSKMVKWLRKNFGERGLGWDFSISNGCVIVEIIDSKYKTMYNLWIL